MRVGILLAPTHRNINGSLRACGVNSVYLFLKQIEIKMRMHLVHLGGIIGISVVALCKYGHKIDLSFLDYLCKFFFIKALAYALNIGACMKVKMHTFHLSFLQTNIFLYLYVTIRPRKSQYATRNSEDVKMVF